MRKFVKKFKNSILGKVLKVIFNILIKIIEILIICIAIIIFVQRVTNNEKSFLGFRIFNVATGSMEPEYAVGDILIAREKDPSTIKVGDNIVYLGNKADYSGRIITHSVVRIEQDEKGEYLFHTMGIANVTEDPVVHEEQLYGVVVQNNIALAWICKILTNTYGLYFCVIIPIVLYAFVEFVKIQGQKIEEEREEERLEKEKEEQLEREKQEKTEKKQKEKLKSGIEQEEKKAPKKQKTVAKEHKKDESEAEVEQAQKEKIRKDRIMLEETRERLKILKKEKEMLDQIANKKDNTNSEE